MFFHLIFLFSPFYIHRNDFFSKVTALYSLKNLFSWPCLQKITWERARIMFETNTTLLFDTIFICIYFFHYIPWAKRNQHSRVANVAKSVTPPLTLLPPYLVFFTEGLAFFASRYSQAEPKDILVTSLSSCADTKKRFLIAMQVSPSLWKYALLFGFVFLRCVAKCSF